MNTINFIFNCYIFLLLPKPLLYLKESEGDNGHCISQSVLSLFRRGLFFAIILANRNIMCTENVRHTKCFVLEKLGQIFFAQIQLFRAGLKIDSFY